MAFGSHNKIMLFSVLATAMALAGCTLHPQRPELTQPSEAAPATKPQTPAADGDDSARLFQGEDPYVTPWLRFPVITALDDETSNLWLSIDGDSAAGPDQNAQDNTADGASSGNAADEDNSDLWERIRLGFKLPGQQNARIEREADWFGRHQAYLDRVADRAQLYLHYIVNQVQQRNMPSEIALLPIVESAFQPYAYSAGRAAGIWQFIPGTGRRYGLKLNWWYDGRRDIVASTQAALDYLQYLHDTFNGDWLLALAAYNSGEGTVEKAIRTNQRHHRATDYWSLRLPRETEQYVPRLLALREIVADPHQQGITLRPIANQAYLTPVAVDSQLDLATAAKLADMDLEELHQLNPGFNRWATAPDGPHSLLLPLEKAALFAINIETLSPKDRVHWVRHHVRGGETLGGIAVHYHTTAKVVADLNKIRGHLIHRGQYLIIPVSSGGDPVYRVTHHASIPVEVSSATKKTVHVVATGDSLWSLAQRYGATVHQLSRWNGISTRKRLHPGQKVVVRLGDSTDNNTSNRSDIIPVSLHVAAASEEVAKPRKITYTVRRGDSLARISQRFRVTVTQVRKWNDIKKNERIQPGQDLTLYVVLTADSERG